MCGSISIFDSPENLCEFPPDFLVDFSLICKDFMLKELSDWGIYAFVSHKMQTSLA